MEYKIGDRLIITKPDNITLEGINPFWRKRLGQIVTITKTFTLSSGEIFYDCHTSENRFIRLFSGDKKWFSLYSESVESKLPISEDVYEFHEWLSARV